MPRREPDDLDDVLRFLAVVAACGWLWAAWAVVYGW